MNLNLDWVYPWIYWSGGGGGGGDYFDLTCYLFHVVIDDHAHVGVESGEWVGSDGRPRPGQRPQKGRLAGIWKTNLDQIK